MRVQELCNLRIEARGTRICYVIFEIGIYLCGGFFFLLMRVHYSCRRAALFEVYSARITFTTDDVYLIS